MIKESELTKDQRSLLLYVETRAVDHDGWIDARQINDVDIAILKQWNDEKFVLFRRASRHRDEIIELTYVVMLSDEAIAMAHELRKQRIMRHIPDMFVKKRGQP